MTDATIAREDEDGDEDGRGRRRGRGRWARLFGGFRASAIPEPALQTRRFVGSARGRPRTPLRQSVRRRNPRQGFGEAFDARDGHRDDERSSNLAGIDASLASPRTMTCVDSPGGARRWRCRRGARLFDRVVPRIFRYSRQGRSDGGERRGRSSPSSRPARGSARLGTSRETTRRNRGDAKRRGGGERGGLHGGDRGAYIPPEEMERRHPAVAFKIAASCARVRARDGKQRQARLSRDVRRGE